MCHNPCAECLVTYSGLIATFLPVTVSHHMGGAIAVAVFIILAFIAGLIFFLYKKKRLQWRGFSSVRYERGMQDDETDSMFTRDGD